MYSLSIISTWSKYQWTTKPHFQISVWSETNPFFKIAMAQYDRYEVDNKEMGENSQRVQMYKTSSISTGKLYTF